MAADPDAYDRFRAKGWEALNDESPTVPHADVMAEVRELQTALAWLHAGIARHDPVRARHAAEAQRLAREIREDSNGSGRSCERSLRALDELLARLETGAAPQRH